MLFLCVLKLRIPPPLPQLGIVFVLRAVEEMSALLCVYLQGDKSERMKFSGWCRYCIPS
jgi:hypothetical protein